MNNQKSGIFYFLTAVIVTLAIFFGIWKAFLEHRVPTKKSINFDFSSDKGDKGDSEDGEVLFKMVGSSTLGKDLAPALAKAFMEKEGMKSINIDKGDSESTITGEKDDKKFVIKIEAETSGEAFNSLEEGNADIGMSSRKIKTEEADKLNNLGDMLSHDCEHIVGLDGIAIIVSPALKIKKINLLQLQEIFSGDIENWNQISGSGVSGDIKVCAREKNSGTNESFKAMVMNGKGITSHAKVFTKNEELVRTVINSDNAIGFVSFASVSSASVLGIQEDANTEPLYPTAFTIATEDYPLCRRLYFYAPSADKEAGKNEHLRAFITFALSDEGQKVVGENNFVELDLKKGEEETLAQLNLVDIPAEYTQATQGALREHLDFRFETGTSKLDNKAIDDIDRLVKLFTQVEYRKKQIILLGFTDDQGADDANRKLAQLRVESVANELSQRGLKVTQKKGLGEIMPVASNVMPLGREKNRRVEVWVK